MPLILRIDVDKPYGNHTLTRKIASKFFEDTGIECPRIGYLDHLVNFLEILSKENVPAIFYFRICTIPDPDLIEKMIHSGHKIGWHLENSKSYQTFENELNQFVKKAGMKPHSFSKHGSGHKKLGRHHYPSYEPQKYLEWAQMTGIPFLFGNEPIKSEQGQNDIFYPKVFWVEKNYRDESFNTVAQAINTSQDSIVTILTHPENVVREQECKNEFMSLIHLSKEKNIQWMVL